MIFTKVLVAEDIDSSKKGIVSELIDIGIETVSHAETCDKAYIKIKQAQHEGEPFQLLISDLSFVSVAPESNLTSGQELIAKVKGEQPDIKTIAFSVWNKQRTVKQLVEDIKVDGYVCKGLNGLRELQKAMEAIGNNSTYLCPLAMASLKQKHVLELNDYEKHILQLVAQGYKQDDISQHFKSKNITPYSRRSIEDHLSKLRDDFNAKTTSQLIYLAQSLDLI